MPITPTIRVMSQRDAARPNLVSRHLLSGDVRDEDCPWVRIGKLYVSVTIVGETSWLPLISRLYKDGRKRYTVFTGRHGDIPNIVENSGRTTGIFDAAHTAEDQVVAQRAIAEFPGIDIDLIDTSARPLQQTQWLKQETTAQIRNGRTVIYAWCYGLFTMCEAPHFLTEARWKKNLESHQAHLTERSVADLVTDYWSWVPNPM